MNYSFNKENNTKVGTYSCGLPTVVMGALIALKHIGMTSMTYWAIIWFGIEIWFCCIALMFAFLLVFMFFAAIFGAWK